MTAPAPAIVVLAPDLLFATRFEDVIRAQGGEPVVAATPEEFIGAVDFYFPVLALVDLDTPGDWRGAIARLKLRPHTRQVPIVAFGSHVEVETLAAARKAGADHAWARSKLMAELPALVDRHLHPPVVYLAGWDAPLPPKARAGVEAFNHGDYFEQHELFEEAWMAESLPIREMYQGILQVGVAFFQIEQNNWAGALKLFRRGLPRLRSLPPICQGVDIAALRDAAEAIHREVTALGPERLHEFERSKFPKIRLEEQSEER
jgi:predicted metal-dependent hydrolase